MDETLEKENPQSEVTLSNEGGIRLRLRDRDLLKKRKAEAEEKATNQWVYGAQHFKQAKKRSSGRKGHPRKQQSIGVSEDFSVVKETDPSPVTLPVLSTAPVTLQPAEPQPVHVETINDKPLKTFLIEDLGPDEEEDMHSQKRIIIDTGDDEQQCAGVPEQSQIFMPAFPSASAPSYPETLPENLPKPLF